jgi:hypothetical protein
MSDGQCCNQENGILWMEKNGLRLVIHPPRQKDTCDLR